MKHILFTLYRCDANLLDDEQHVKDVVLYAAIKCKSTLLAINSHKFEPQGVTCVAMLAESHISIHTWPEKEMAVCDIFTCGDHTNPMDGFWYMKDALKSTVAHHKEYNRPQNAPVPIDEQVHMVVSQGTSML